MLLMDFTIESKTTFICTYEKKEKSYMLLMDFTRESKTTFICMSEEKGRECNSKGRKNWFEYGQKEITIRRKNKIQNLYKCITQRPCPKACSIIIYNSHCPKWMPIGSSTSSPLLKDYK